MFFSSFLNTYFSPHRTDSGPIAHFGPNRTIKKKFGHGQACKHVCAYRTQVRRPNWCTRAFQQ